MSTRTRRWLTILVALAIPVAIFFTATRSYEPPQKINTKFPASCTSIYRQAENGDLSKATEAATTLVTSKDSTVEEQTCAKTALVGLAAAGGAAAAPTDLSKVGGCRVAKAFEDHGSQAAAVAAYRVLNGSGTAAEKACATRGLQRLNKVSLASSPKCVSVARLYLLSTLQKAADTTTSAFADERTTDSDVICLANVAAAVQELTAATPATLTDAALQPKEEDFPKLCADAAAAASEGKIAEARSTYERQLKDAKDEKQQACAVGGLARLSAEDTFADWSFAQANRVAKRLTGWIPGGPLVFADGSKNVVVAIFWLLLVGLLVVALRQVIRWRRERWPGPVVISALQAAANPAPGATETVDVAEVIRHDLSRAGIYERAFAGGAGDLFVDVSAALGVAGETGPIGRIVEAVKSAVTIKAGFEMTIHQDHDVGNPDGPHQLVIELNEAETGNTWCVREYAADTVREAAQRAAFGTYLDLFAREEVRRRTPSYLTWSSIDGLIEYHAADDDERAGKLRSAIEHLTAAADQEPANLFVQLLLTLCYQRLAEGTPEDKALRGSEDVGSDYLAALQAAIRAVLLERYSSEAQGRLAIVLGYVSQWKDAWATNPSKGVLTRLLDELGDLPPASIVDKPGDSAFELHFLERAQAHWRASERCTHWWVVFRIALRLDRRRTVRGQVWPFRRGRKSTHDLLLAADVKTRYDRFIAGWKPSRGERALALFHLLRVRFGRLWWLRRLPEQEGNVQYNLAAAYVGRALYLNNGADPLTHKANKVMQRALKTLQRSYAGTGRVMLPGDLSMVETDPDFDGLKKTKEYLRWAARFGVVNEVEIAKREWRGLFATLAARADTASRCWHDHLEQPIPNSRRWNAEFSKWAADALTWIGDDLERWNALGAWVEHPAGLASRSTFEKSIKAPGINGSRPFRSTTAPILPGDQQEEVDTVRSKNLAMFRLVKPSAELAATMVEDDLATALEYVCAQNAPAFEAHLREVAYRYAQIWSDLSRWALRPTVRGSEPVEWTRVG